MRRQVMRPSAASRCGVHSFAALQAMSDAKVAARARKAAGIAASRTDEHEHAELAREAGDVLDDAGRVEWLCSGVCLGCILTAVEVGCYRGVRWAANEPLPQLWSCFFPGLRKARGGPLHITGT